MEDLFFCWLLRLKFAQLIEVLQLFVTAQEETGNDHRGATVSV